MQYTVVKFNSLDDLIDVVNKYISAGYKPIGGIHSGKSDLLMYWAQAMLKE